MTGRCEDQERYAALFESITGESTIVTRQDSSCETRLDAHGTGREISDYVTIVGSANGLEDAIGQPELF